MSTTKKATRKPKVQFLGTLDELPLAGNGGGVTGPAPHWVEVAQHAKANPGVWHRVEIDHLTIKGHQSAVHQINAASRDTGSRTAKNAAFREPGFQAAYRKGHGLLVRYDVPVVTKLRGRKSA